MGDAESVNIRISRSSYLCYNSAHVQWDLLSDTIAAVKKVPRSRHPLLRRPERKTAKGSRTGRSARNADCYVFRISAAQQNAWLRTAAVGAGADH